jgi:hypothetical protein
MPMRVIRPATLASRRRFPLGTAVAVAMLGSGVAAAALLLVAAPTSAVPAALLGLGAALGLGLGAAWLVRALRPDPARRLLVEIERLLRDAFDDTYTLIIGPRLPLRRTDIGAILVGPSGVRVLVARDWEGRYRVRGRGWEFDTRSGRGWIACRTNPSFDAVVQADAVAAWARDAGLGTAPVSGAIVFPNRRSRIVLEEPDDEVVTSDNVPWWANRIGRVQRMDAAATARFVSAVLAAAEAPEVAPIPQRGTTGAAR